MRGITLTIYSRRFLTEFNSLVCALYVRIKKDRNVCLDDYVRIKSFHLWKSDGIAYANVMGCNTRDLNGMKWTDVNTRTILITANWKLQCFPRCYHIFAGFWLVVSAFTASQPTNTHKHCLDLSFTVIALSFCFQCLQTANIIFSIHC